jgi:hypothetical protein
LFWFWSLLSGLVLGLVLLPFGYFPFGLLSLGPVLPGAVPLGFVVSLGAVVPVVPPALVVSGAAALGLGGVAGGAVVSGVVLGGGVLGVAVPGVPAPFVPLDSVGIALGGGTLWFLSRLRHAPARLVVATNAERMSQRVMISSCLA